MKKLLLLLTVLYSFSAVAQKPKKVIKKLGSDPIFYIDSVNVDKSELQNYKPTDIAAVSVYRDSDAIKLAGPEGKDGVVYIETKYSLKKRIGLSFLQNRKNTRRLFRTPKQIRPYNIF
jgi:hypothetical protein